MKDWPASSTDFSSSGAARFRGGSVEAGTARVPADCPDRPAESAGPRLLTFIAVKRTAPRLLAPYGHWWVEMDRKESYGWWPDRPLRLRHWVKGTGGCLNGTWLHAHASPQRDALHRVPADHRFHPLLTVAKTDDQVRDDIRSFAASYRGGWRWEWPWSMRSADNCRTFQLRLFAAVGLSEPPGLLYTRGSGCPVLFPLRRFTWSAADRVRRWSRQRSRRSAGTVAVSDSETRLNF